VRDGAVEGHHRHVERNLFHALHLQKDSSVFPVVGGVPVGESAADREGVALDVLGKISLGAYFAFDHVMYAIKVGLYKPPPSVVAVWNKLTEGSWVSEIVFGILLGLLRLFRTRNAADSTESRAAAAVQWRSVVRNGLDLPIALHFLGLTGTYPHGHFGILGVLSSLISLWELWPVVNSS